MIRRPLAPPIRPGLALLAVALSFALSACASDRRERERLEAERRITDLPARWREMEPFAFEELVFRLFPTETETPLAEPVRRELQAALAETPATSVRAAVLLGRSRDPAAGQILAARLEQRVAGAERISDSGDVVAAGALVPLCDAALAGRLAALAIGPAPHPDLDVRVECARTALRAGRDDVAPFLLSVLRIGTRAGRAEGTFWPPPPHTAWPRERAAEVLAWRAGLENHYSADASLDDRDREAERFAAKLAELGVAVQ